MANNMGIRMELRRDGERDPEVTVSANDSMRCVTLTQESDVVMVCGESIDDLISMLLLARDAVARK